MSEKETGLVELCEWLRANSSGAYRKSEEAADTIERLQAELAEVKAHYAVDTEVLDAVGAELEDVEYLGGYSEGVKKMKADLAACQLERDSALKICGQTRLALALRVKSLEGALEHIATSPALHNGWNEFAKMALSTSDRTSEEAIAEFLGEPVAFSGKDRLTAIRLRCDIQDRHMQYYTPLYSPKVKP